MRKVKLIFTNWRIILMLLILLLSFVSINPHFFREGVAIRSVELNSSAALAGIEPPLPQDQPVSRERITSVNDNPVATVEDYYNLIGQLDTNDTVYVKTNKARYRLLVKEEYTYHETNETEVVVIEDVIVVNETINGTVQELVKKINTTVERPKVERKSAGPSDIGLNIYPSPTSNIKKGLDLQGGTRVLLQPEVFLTPVDLETLIDSMKQRLNVYGLSDIAVKPAGDLPPPLGAGNQYILVEVAGVSESEIKDLLAKQGKFEAKIAGTTVFRGGDDITFVCRSAQCSGIDPNRGCSSHSGGQNICGFYFSITLGRQAAERQALATSTLDVIQDQGGAYLSSPLELHLDDQKVDELNIAAGLKGEPTTNIQITGSGVGSSVEAAGFNAIQNMKRLQTILITGSLPVKMEVVKVDEVSPVLGKEFVKNSIIMAMVAILAVAIVVGIRYRKPIISVPIVITMTAEIVILLGVASLIKWNIDLAAIAGIIAAIGTGVDHQIVITDEALRGQVSSYNWKERVKRAFLIIMLAYMTIFAAMFPLIFAGAGLLKGFAITTLAGVTIGVLITRPAFSAILEILLK